MPVGSLEIFDEATVSLERMQKFDVETLPREDDLGRELAFGKAVKPAQVLIDLYNRLSVTALEDFPDNLLPGK